MQSSQGLVNTMLSLCIWNDGQLQAASLVNLLTLKAWRRAAGDVEG